MPTVLFYDTETSGLPDWHAPSEAPQQPHIVQIAAGLVDVDTRAMVAGLDLIVAPDGWTIPDDVAQDLQRNRGEAANDLVLVDGDHSPQPAA